MNRYEISFTEHNVPREESPTGTRRVVLGIFEAATGIEAIKVGLRAKGVEEADIESGRSIGSIKRLVIAGITFEANKKERI